jgi:hypothetical protein
VACRGRALHHQRLGNRRDRAAAARALRLKLMFRVVGLALSDRQRPSLRPMTSRSDRRAARHRVAVFAASVMTLYLNACIAKERQQSNLRVIFLESVMGFTASINACPGRRGFTGAACGRAIGYGFGALVRLVLARRTLEARPPPALEERAHARTAQVRDATVRYHGRLPLLSASTCC